MQDHNTALTATKQSQLIFDWNNTDSAYPDDKLIQQLFESQVELTPDAIAAVFEEGKLTYRQLNEKANQLAFLLRERYEQSKGSALQSDSLIAICIDRSLEMLVGILGIIKAGAAYVPMDPSYPKQRLQYILSDTQAELLVTNNQVLAKQSWLKQDIVKDLVNIDESVARLNVLSKSNPELINQVQDLAYVIYTSGSTGKPKGVMISHQALSHSTHARKLWYFQSGHNNLLLSSSFSFDSSVAVIWGGLLNGSTIFIASAALVQSPVDLANYIANRKISHILTTPSFYSSLLMYLKSKKVGDLRQVTIAGEAFFENLLVRHNSIMGDVELINEYGPTENCVWATVKKLKESINMGKLIGNVKGYVLDEAGNQSRIGAVGELYLGGAGLARGYLNRPELSAEKFIDNPFVLEADKNNGSHLKLYKTGDLVRWLADGELEFMGRIDDQVKIRGYRIELGEIEASLSKLEDVSQGVVVVKQLDESDPASKQLLGFYVVNKKSSEKIRGKQAFSEYVRKQLANVLPVHMLPNALILLDEFPLTHNGKIDRKALAAYNVEASYGEEDTVKAVNDVEKKLLAVWSALLKINHVSAKHDFFSLGGHSLLIPVLLLEIEKNFDIKLNVADIFQYPKFHALAEYISKKINFTEDKPEPVVQSLHSKRMVNDERDIAVIGIACRALGADDHQQYWRNLVNGVETICDLSDSDLIEAGIDQNRLSEKNYIKRGGVVNHYKSFDAGFFGISGIEAKVMDPQHRHFLEICWTALEDAAVVPAQVKNKIGVFAGQAQDYYFRDHVMGSKVATQLGDFMTDVHNEAGYITTKASYALGLKGPSLNIQTGCSTSLVAIHTAIKSLIFNECQIALAGGISLSDLSGYEYKEGHIASSDGHCKPFDDNADGTVLTNAGGVVVLKRLSKALDDNDHIYAVIKGSAINNDGHDKMTYTAPSVNGQIEVITDALEAANVHPDSISYVEAHGTGTVMGDPIEVSALSQAYQQFTRKKNYCAIGSVKGNIGHTTAAAGVMGLIKVCMALKHKQLPESLHCKKPNSSIDWQNSPFFVNTELTDWKTEGDMPRRAAISSFGIGGTNAHMILEEAPVQQSENSSHVPEILIFSAKTALSLMASIGSMAKFLQNNSEINLSDVAYTLQAGRENFAFRQHFVCESVADAIQQLKNYRAIGSLPKLDREISSEMVFMFPGQGAQYPAMAASLYDAEPVFKQVIDDCSKTLSAQAKIDFISLWRNSKSFELQETHNAQLVLFVVEYAYARLLMSKGFEPKMMIGHSLGEYVAATLSGVFALEAALLLIVERGRLMQAMPSGSMLFVALSEKSLTPILPAEIVIAGVNGPSSCVVSGAASAIKNLQHELDRQEISNIALKVSHAFHSPLMKDAADEFSVYLDGVEKHKPKIPFLSNLSGKFITDFEAKSSDYWAKHLLHTVRFSEGIQTIQSLGDYSYVEVGPGKSLSGFVKSHLSASQSHTVIQSLGHVKDKRSDELRYLDVFGKLWRAGVKVDWEALRSNNDRFKISLPTYHFDHKQYWIEKTQQKSVQEKDVELLKIKARKIALVSINEKPAAESHDDIGYKAVIRELWSDLLGVTSISDDDDFFDLGGHSLLSIQFLAALNQRLRIQIKAAEFFANSSLRQLTDFVNKREIPANHPFAEVQVDRYCLL